MLREEIEKDRVVIKWMPTKQNIADMCTKEFLLVAEELSYASTCIRNAQWSLGRDPRAPVDLRGRKNADQLAQGKLDFESNVIQEPDAEADSSLFLHSQLLGKHVHV